MSNGLDALREMVDLTFKYDDNLINKMANLSNIVLQDLERLQKLEKVVEILKSKEIFEFKDDNCLYLNAEDHNWWGDIIEDSFVRLSEEENDLLKEVFGE